jgi:hypothetical protein
MANNRIFYACQAVALAPLGSDAGAVLAHGVQSVGITTNFNLEQAFELGQIQIYENIEGLPDIEVTMEKVLDGYPLLYHLASPGATSSNLIGRSKERCTVGLGIFSDDADAVDGAAPVEVYMSGMFINSVSYTIPADGNCTESVTLVGNNKEWNTTARLLRDAVVDGIPKDSSGRGIDVPFALSGVAGEEYNGGIQRRENVVMSQCIIPKSIIRSLNGAAFSSISETAGNNWNSAAATPRAHIQSVTISTDFGREDILELGRKTPYFRAPTFPIEVTCEIEVISISGDWVSAYETGNPALTGASAGDNTPSERIVVALQDGTKFDLGTKNRLSSVTYGGGDAGGGNSTMTFSYSNFNDLVVQHNQDPAQSTIGYSDNDYDADDDGNWVDG